MPLYSEKAELEKLRKQHFCFVCGDRLDVFHDVDAGMFYLACHDYLRTKHEGITRHDKQQGKYIKEIKEAYKMDSKSLMTMTETTMLARVEMAKFPQDLTVPEKRLLAQVAITYGFDPLMGEVSIYQGKPFVSIDGRYRKAQETGKLDGVLTRPANKKEHEDWQIPEGDYFFRAEVFVKDATHAFVGWGRVYAAEITGGKGFKPVEKNPQRMAEKRAEAQALRKAFHIPLPSVEEIGSPDEEQRDIPANIKVLSPEDTASTEKPIKDETKVALFKEVSTASKEDLARLTKAMGIHGQSVESMKKKCQELGFPQESNRLTTGQIDALIKEIEPKGE